MNKTILIIIGILVLVTLILSGCGETTYTTSAKGCDKIAGCSCLHESYGGLGACDSCQCTKSAFG